MSSFEKNLPFGAKQEIVLTPKVGFELEAVEIVNRSTNELVPYELNKICDNPAQWTCSFFVPAGMVSIRPKTRPILYTVFIEDCDDCNIVLLESSEVLDMKIGSTATSSIDGGASPTNGSQEAAGLDDSEALPVNEQNVPPEDSHGNPSQTPANDLSGVNGALNNTDVNSQLKESEETNVLEENSSETPAADTVNMDDALVDEGKQELEMHSDVNINAPQHSDNSEDVVDSSNEENEQAEDIVENNNDVIYDAGDFQDELKEVEPIRISLATHDKRCEAYWQRRKLFTAGQISKEEFDEVEKKHMQFMDDLSEGRIIIE